MSLVFIVLNTSCKLITPTTKHVSNVSSYSHSNYSYCCCLHVLEQQMGSININQLIKTEKSNSINNKFQERKAYLQIPGPKNTIIIKILKKPNFSKMIS